MDRVMQSSSVRGNEPTGQCLNLDILVYIFGHINKQDLISCASVCKMWKTAAYRPVLWKDFLFDIRQSDLGNGLTMQSLIERKINAFMIRYWAVKGNDVEGFEETDVTTMIDSMSVVLNIDTLTLSEGCATSGKDHMGLPLMPSNVYALSPTFAFAPTARSLATLTALVILDVSPLILNRLLSDISLRPLPNMKLLSLHAQPSRDLNIRCPTPVFDSVFALCPNLNDLQLAEEYFCDLYTYSIQHPSTPNIFLRRLALLNFGLTLKAISKLAIGFPKLTNLELVSRNMLRDSPKFRVKLPVLVSLRFEVSHLPAAYSITDAIDMFADCKKVKTLSLCLDRNIYHFADRLLDADFDGIADVFPYLRVVNISGREVFAEEILIRFLNRMKVLETLIIQSIWGLDADTMTKIISSSPSLKCVVRTRKDEFHARQTEWNDDYYNGMIGSSQVPHCVTYPAILRCDSTSGDWHESVSYDWFEEEAESSKQQSGSKAFKRKGHIIGYKSQAIDIMKGKTLHGLKYACYLSGGHPNMLK